MSQPTKEKLESLTNDSLEAEKKRKGETVSSVSSILDSSTISWKEEKDEDISDSKERKTKKKKKRKDNTKQGITNTEVDTTKPPNTTMQTTREGDIQHNINKILLQISDMNKKLANVVTRDDGSLREIIREVFSQMKDEFLKSVSYRIDILESKLFDKESENDKLRGEIHRLETELKEQEEENCSLRNNIERCEDRVNERMNDLEQYSRINNIRIDGIEEEDDESVSDTEEKVVKELNSRMPKLNLTTDEIEIAHRLGKNKGERPRQIIVQFMSRATKSEIMKRRKLLKGGFQLCKKKTER